MTAKIRDRSPEAVEHLRAALKELVAAAEVARSESENKHLPENYKVSAAYIHGSIVSGITLVQELVRTFRDEVEGH